MYVPTVHRLESSPGTTSCSIGSEPAAASKASSSASGSVADQRGPPEAALERQRIRRLDDRRVAELARDALGLGAVGGVGGTRGRDAGAGRGLVLVALVLQRPDDVPAGAGQR